MFQPHKYKELTIDQRISSIFNYRLNLTEPHLYMNDFYPLIVALTKLMGSFPQALPTFISKLTINCS